VFEKAKVSFAIPLSKASAPVAPIGDGDSGALISIDFSNEVAFQGTWPPADDDTTEVDVTVATKAGSSFSFSPAVQFSMDLDWSGLHSMSLSVKAGFEAGVDFSVTVSGQIELAKITAFDIPLLPPDPIPIMVGPVPVVIVPGVDLKLEPTLTMDTGLTVSGGIKAASDMTIGFSYENGTVTPIAQNNGFNYGPFGPTFSLESALSVDAAVPLHFDFMIYGVAGPWVEIGPDATLSVSPSNGGFDFSLEAGVKATAGATVSVFGHDLADFEVDVFSGLDVTISTGPVNPTDDDDDASPDDDTSPSDDDASPDDDDTTNTFYDDFSDPNFGH
jgi:hypothetical protein